MDMRWMRKVGGKPSESVRPKEAARAILPEIDACQYEYSCTKVVPLPAEHFGKNRIILDEQSEAAGQFKLLRTQVFNRTRPKGWNTVQVTGFGPREGKSFVAMNLAISIAKDSRQTTLLVDLDFRNPSIAGLLALDKSRPGLTSYFFDGIGLEEIFINPGIEKLTVLPAGEKIAHASELIGSSRMEALIKELKQRYQDRYIIFDTPPMVGFPDSLVFSDYVDSMILVARAGCTTRDDVQTVMDLVRREKILGLVFNDVQGPAPANYS
jgi:capsular exopolysaccharide synthesis family protein